MAVIHTVQDDQGKGEEAKPHPGPLGRAGSLLRRRRAGRAEGAAAAAGAHAPPAALNARCELAAPSSIAPAVRGERVKARLELRAALRSSPFPDWENQNEEKKQKKARSGLRAGAGLRSGVSDNPNFFPRRYLERSLRTRAPRAGLSASPAAIYPGAGAHPAHTRSGRSTAGPEPPPLPSAARPRDQPAPSAGPQSYSAPRGCPPRSARVGGEGAPGRMRATSTFPPLLLRLLPAAAPPAPPGRPQPLGGGRPPGPRDGAAPRSRPCRRRRPP